MHLKPISALSLIAVLAMSSAHAQDTANVDADFPTSEQLADEANGVVARHGDWQIRCNDSDVCRLFQAGFDPDGNEVANLSLQALPEGSAAVLGAVVITPHLTLLPRGVTMGVDDGVPAAYPYGWCDAAGCYARFGMTANQVDAMKAGTSAYVSVYTVVNQDEEVKANVSLAGFTAALEDLMSRQ